jgi:hypothetical protein
MGFLDKAKKQLSDAGGKHTDKIEKGVAKAKDGLDKLDGRNDDIPDDK